MLLVNGSRPERKARPICGCLALAEQMEAKLARGRSINVQQQALLCSTMVRVARQIEIKRVLRNVTPALADYLELKANRALLSEWLSVNQLGYGLPEAGRLKGLSK